MQCQNEDEPCGRVATRIYVVKPPGSGWTTSDHVARVQVTLRAIRVCKRCYNRYQNHGDGRKLNPWDAKKGRIPNGAQDA